MIGLFCHINRPLLSYNRSLLTEERKEKRNAPEAGGREDMYMYMYMRKCQKRPMYMAKEAYVYGKRGLLSVAYLRPAAARICICTCMYVYAYKREISIHRYVYRYTHRVEAGGMYAYKREISIHRYMYRYTT